MFRPSDERRVQAHFDSILPAPYEAEISMSADRTQMTVRVMDPDDAEAAAAVDGFFGLFTNAVERGYYCHYYRFGPINS